MSETRGIGMLDKRTDGLLLEAAFGELSPGDRATVDALLASSVEARERFAAWQRLAEDLRNDDRPEAPQDLGAMVMRTVSVHDDARPDGDTRVDETRGERVMGRKLMMGIAATVAVGLGLYVALGGSVPPDGVAGTIGAAKRYQGQQISAADVKLGDAAMQTFLQSAAFDRLRRDANARRTFQKVVTNANVAVLLKSGSFRDLISHAELRRAVVDADLRALLADTEFRALLHDTDLRRAVSDTDLRKAVSDVELRQAYSDTELRALVNDTALARLVNDTELAALLQDTELQALFNDTELAALFNDSEFAALFSHAEFAALMQDSAFKALVSNANFVNLSSDALDAALRAH